MAILSMPHRFNISFLKHKKLPLILLLFMGMLSFSGMFFQKLKFGIDFKGGTLIEARLNREVDLDVIRKDVQKVYAEDFSLQATGNSGTEVMLRTGPRADMKQFLDQIKKALGQGAEIRRVESVGPKMGRELIMNSLYAMLGAFLAIMVYVWIRFEWEFSLCAMVALVHDCLGVLAFYSLFQREFNENAVVALLITLSYSINDTIIIFDRIRENRFYQKGKKYKDILNISLNETLSRTILTSVTTLLALGVLYFLGGSVIRDFSLPILVGIAAGTYSSIFIATPLLQFFPSAVVEKLKGQKGKSLK